MEGECVRANQMVLWMASRHLKSSNVGGLHLVITDVVPIGGGVDRKKRVLVLFTYLSEGLRRV